MAWKKIVVSGSAAQLASATVDGALVASSITGSANFDTLANKPSLHSGSAQVVDALVNQTVNLGTGAITASYFKGDGSGLENLDIAQVATIVRDFTNVTSYTVTHNFGSKNVMLTVYDENDYQIFPATVQADSDNTATITFDTATTGTVIVGKGGHVVSGSVEYANIINKPSLVSGSDQVEALFNVTSISSSIASEIAALESFSSSLDATFATDAELSSVSASLAATIAGLDGDYATNAELNSSSSALQSNIDGVQSNLDSVSSSLAAAIDSAEASATSALNTSSSALQSNIDGVASDLSTASSSLAGRLATIEGDNATQTELDAVSSSLASTIDNLSSTLAISGSTGSDSVNLKTDSLSFVGASSQITTTVTNNQVQVGFVTNPIISGNLTVTGNLNITGDTIQAQVANINVEDRFILLNSGSATGDAGIIFGGSDGTANEGSGIFWDSPANVFGFAQGIDSADTVATHTSKLGNIQVASANPSTAPTFQGTGTVHVNDSDGGIWIYS